MPRLLLLRHAKSSWGDAGVADIDRPLSPRGRRAAAALAKAIAAAGLLPDRVLCSPAQRTRETLAALMPHLPAKAAVAITPELYEPTAGDYRSTIAEHGEDAEALMVIGHNPAIQATALILIGAGDAHMSNDVARKFPTGALAVIAFPSADWSRIAPHSGRIEAFIKPREIEDEEGDGKDKD
jgi:phosphohistidine phosphatase